LQPVSGLAGNYILDEGGRNYLSQVMRLFSPLTTTVLFQHPSVFAVLVIFLFLHSTTINFPTFRQKKEHYNLRHNRSFKWLGKDKQNPK
jgi:hypothetical protein